MSQPDRRSLLIGACRKRQDQIRHKLAQVRQRLQITDGLDNERWAQVERDLLARFDQEEERVQRLLNESQESLDAPHSHEAGTPSGERPEPGRSALLMLQQNYKKAQLLLAQKNEQIARLQKEIESKPAAPQNSDAELLVKEQTIAKLRQQNQALTAQVSKLKAEVIDEEELDELHRQNEALSNALEERDQAAAGLRAEIARLQTPSSADQEELEELHRQNAALSNELAYRDENEAELRAEILRLQEAPPSNEQEFEDLQRQNEYLNQELSLRDQSEAQLRGEIARLQTVEKLAADLREQNTTLTEQTDSLLRNLTEFEGRIVELNHQNEALRADLDLKTEVTGRVQFDLELKTGEFDRLSRDYQQRGAQLEELQRQVDDLVKESAAASPTDQKAAHQQELLEQLALQAEKHEQEMASKVEPLQAQVAQLQQQLEQALQSPAAGEADLQAEIADLRQQLESAAPSNDIELQAQITELQEQLEQARTAAGSNDGELQAEIAASNEAGLQAQIAELQEQLEQARTAAGSKDSDLQAELADLRQQLEQAQALATSSEAELQAEVADLRQQLEQTRALASSSEDELQARIADLQQQLEQAVQAPPSEDSETQAEIADLRQQLEQAQAVASSSEAELQAEIADLRQQILDVQPELERLREQARQSQALVPPDDPEKQQLQARVTQLEQQLASGGDPAEVQQLKDKLAIQSDKFQLELELLRSAHKVVDSELAKLLEAPLGAAAAPAPRTNTTGYLGGDPSPEDSGYLGAAPAQPPPPRPPMRPVTPVAKTSGWLGATDEEPWDGYVRPNYSKAGLPPGAAGAAKLAARSANLSATTSIEDASKQDLPPLELSEASQEEAANWLAGPDTSDSDELPDWLTAEKPTE